MSTIRAIGYPARRTAGSWVFDVLLTLGAVCMAIPFAVHQDQHPPSAGTIVLLALATAPLVARQTSGDLPAAVVE